jgi:hypothetical protein
MLSVGFGTVMGMGMLSDDDSEEQEGEEGEQEQEGHGEQKQGEQGEQGEQDEDEAAARAARAAKKAYKAWMQDPERIPHGHDDLSHRGLPRVAAMQGRTMAAGYADGSIRLQTLTDGVQEEEEADTDDDNDHIDSYKKPWLHLSKPTLPKGVLDMWRTVGVKEGAGGFSCKTGHSGEEPCPFMEE